MAQTSEGTSQRMIIGQGSASGDWRVLPLGNSAASAARMRPGQCPTPG